MMPFMCTSSTRKGERGGGAKWLPVKIITDDTLETLVFGNTKMNDSLDAV